MAPTIEALINEALGMARRRGRILRAITLSGSNHDLMATVARSMLDQQGLDDVDLRVRSGMGAPRLAEIETADGRL